MPGTLHSRIKQAGNGHGARNHRHASGNGLTAWYYASFHCKWRPERVIPKRESSSEKHRRKIAANRKNRRKQ